MRCFATDHTSEIVLLGLIAIGVTVLAGLAIWKGEKGEAAAWSTVLMAIVNAIKERWTQRSIDRMGQQLGQSQPPEGRL